MPAQFADLEPVVSYLYFAARSAGNDPIVGHTQAGDRVEGPGERVTSWPLATWRTVWERAAVTVADQQAVGPIGEGLGGHTSEDASSDGGRRALALAIVILLTMLVGALAAAAFIISSLTM